ncbi:uncharacterized protein BDCG_16290 [Blastomyces dermatitidis ER-3]|uniref:Uncharacterized protein n=2 Tax=Ajellomyces dermatitidis TaxID=5039 RepID=F2TMW4_AJEDA|nr:uncharacterized protein BDCG_16290 [Blastomyces dermatitidis ER-3]EGE84577.1 hypothetical protein BDDG_07522 [Blastomyces dermatitidis ATCC 18188]OAS99736.1 hypothetical protein BDCG_16290 [Blastomyces dermatitidis ER-3]
MPPLSLEDLKTVVSALAQKLDSLNIDYAIMGLLPPLLTCFPNQLGHTIPAYKLHRPEGTSSSWRSSKYLTPKSGLNVPVQHSGRYMEDVQYQRSREATDIRDLMNMIPLAVPGRPELDLNQSQELRNEKRPALAQALKALKDQMQHYFPKLERFSAILLNPVIDRAIEFHEGRSFQNPPSASCQVHMELAICGGLLGRYGVLRMLLQPVTWERQWALCRSRGALKCAVQWGQNWPHGSKVGTVPFHYLLIRTMIEIIILEPLHILIRDTQHLSVSPHTEKPASLSSSIAALTKLSASVCTNR